MRTARERTDATPRRAITHAALRLGMLTLLAGCDAGPEMLASRQRTVEPAAFRGDAGAASSPANGGADGGAVGAGAGAAPGSGAETSQGGEIDEGPDNLAIGESEDGTRTAESYRVRPGEPVRMSAPGAPVEEPQLLDAKVGDINGRPLFVSEFLRPIEGRLRAEANRLGRDEWMRTAARIIQEEMRALITDELLKAEALSRLSVEQKAGLRRFLEDVRQNLLSENRGSQQLAEERLRREEGLSQEEYLRQREDRTLVRFTLQEEIQDRINVSWRDILQRYARDEDRYNPDPTARFAILQVPAPPPPVVETEVETEAETDPAGEAATEDETPLPDAELSAANAALPATGETSLDKVRARLAAGETIEQIAGSDLNTWTVDAGGVREVVLTGDIADVVLFGPPEINDRVRELTVGGMVGPIEYNGNLYWIGLSEIVRGGTSLYDAQLEISEQIRSERTATELQRYIDRLLGRASVSDVDRMMVRLLAIAAERYGPAPSGGASGGGNNGGSR